MTLARALVVVVGAAIVASAQTAATRFQFVDRPTLIDCAGSACFRVALNVVDSAGMPVAPASSEGFEVRSDGRSYQPFHTEFLGTASTSTSPNRLYALLLFDTSGSMNTPLRSGQTRFGAARASLQRFVSTFREGTTFVAIAPFDSRNVRQRVEAVPFVTSSSDVQAQISSLQTTKGNTALYSAMLYALPRLEAEKARGAQVLLVAFTDGANDVRPGDDPGLLGADGLERVRAAADRSDVPIVTVGFGEAGNAAFDEKSLRSLASTASNYYQAGSEDQIGRVFEAAGKKLTNRVLLTFGPVGDKRLPDLIGQTLSFSVAQQQPDGRTIETDTQAVWAAPPFGSAPPHTSLTQAEAEAFAGSRQVTIRPGASLLEPLIILVGFGVAFAGLWFGVPRVVWPERYAPKPPPVARQTRVTFSGPSAAGKPDADGPATAKPGSRSRVAPITPPISRGSENAPRDPGDATTFRPPQGDGKSPIR